MANGVDNVFLNENGAIEVPKIKIKEEEKEKIITKADILRKLSSGTGLREALNDIVGGGMGALIVVSNQAAFNLFKGGFYVNCKFNSKKLFELAKMDGAIILSEDFKKILHANTLLIPSMDFNSSETGTRHQAAERTAKQINGLVIAVSERRGTITIYYGNSRYVLQNAHELLRRATETLQILEKQIEVFSELIANLNVLEITNLVSVADVCTILERLEMIRKMTNIINEYIVELGKDVIILRLRMRELTKGIEEKEDFIIKDYISKPSRVGGFFDSLNFDELLDLETISRVLFAKSLDTSVIPKGYRLLNKTHLNKNEIESLIKYFKNIDGVFNSDKEALERVVKENAENLIKELNVLKEHIMVGKKV